MDKKKISLLTSLDQFGVAYSNTIQGREKLYKTLFGSIFSLILYIIAIAYFINIMILWRSGSIQPKIAMRQRITDYEDIQFDYQPIRFSMFKKPDELDPFDKHNNILMPIMMTIDDVNFLPPQTLLSNQVPSTSNLSTQTIIPSDLNLVLNTKGISPASPKTQKQVLISFIKCNATLLSDGEKCASQQTIDQYFSYSQHIININIELKQFNLAINGFDSISKQIYLQLDPDMTIYSQTLFKTTTSRTNRGIVFNDYSYYKYVNNFEFITQSITPSRMQKLLGFQTYAGFLMRIDSLAQEEFIQYPNLGEILAEVGSIITLLFTTKALVFMINHKQLEDMILNEIISSYYPEYSLIAIKTNFLGKIKEVIYKEKKYDPIKFTEFHQKLREQAARKLNIVNQIYETSRIKFALRSLMTQQNMKFTHSVGIALNLDSVPKEQEIQKIVPKSSIGSEEHEEESIQVQDQEAQPPPIVSLHKLTDEDFCLFDWENKPSIGEKDIEEMDEFFKINRLT